MKKVKIVAFNVLWLLTGLAGIELLFGGWLNKKNQLNNIGILRNLELTYSIGNLYPHKDGMITYTRDKFGLRGLHSFNNPQKIDILTVGGSTTDQRYIDDKETWQQLLEDSFKRLNRNLVISNAGVDGQSTVGHIKNFEIWFPKVPDLKPRYILFYIGINDFYLTPEHASFDYLKPDNKPQGIFSEFKNNSVLYNLFRKINGSLKSKQWSVGHHKINFDEIEYTDSALMDEKMRNKYVIENLLSFKERVIKLIELTEKLGAEPIFMTQVSRKYKFIDNRVLGIASTEKMNGYVYNGVDYFYLTQELNTKIKGEAGTKYKVIDLTDLHIWEDSDFYDFFHQTPAGAKKLSLEIFNQLDTIIK